MVRIIAINVKVYNINEAQEKLARMTHHYRPRYSRQRWEQIIAKYSPELKGGLLTDADLDHLAKCIKTQHRRKNNY